MTLHINSPAGYYLGQVIGRGERKWNIVTGKCKTRESAMSKALKELGLNSKARVIFCDDSGYYGATVVMELKRCQRGLE